MSKPVKTKKPETTPDDFIAGVEEGLADVKAGRTVPYEKVRRWLLSWGTGKELPRPK